MWGLTEGREPFLGGGNEQESLRQPLYAILRKGALAFLFLETSVVKSKEGLP